MKIAFIFRSLSANKWYAPLISEALARGVSVEIWLDQKDLSKTTKWYEFPSQNKMPLYSSLSSPTFRKFQTLKDLEDLVKNSDADIVFSHHPPMTEKPKTQKWAHIVTTYFDSMVGIPAADLNRFDVVFVNTDRWIYLAKKYYQLTGQIDVDTSKWLAVGTPQFDHFFLCDQIQSRKKLGIPEGKRVVTVYAFETSATYWCQRIFHETSTFKRLFYWLCLPFSYPYILSKKGLSKLLLAFLKSLKARPEMLWQALRCPSEKDVLLAVREFCDKNNYFFLLKARKKNPLKAFHRDIPDLVIEEDTEYFPYTSARVLSASDLLITFYSSAAGEAVFSGKPVLNLIPPKDAFYFKDHYLFLAKQNSRNLESAEEEVFYNHMASSFFEYEGAVKSLTIAKAIDFLRNANIEDFRTNEKGRKSYILEFVCAEEGPVSPAILDHLKKLVGGATKHL